MGDAQAPGGYFVGRPANYEDKPQDPAPSAPDGPPGEHVPPHHPAPAPDGQKKPGFLGNLFSCFSGGRAES